MLTTPQAARLVGVSPATIRKWRERGHLRPQGLDERGCPLHTVAALREAEQGVRRRGLATTGIDPRKLRGRTRYPAASPFPAAA